ncbi:MAG TPA: DNA translocase FtsK [Dehalococcoidia bacterium]|nr:DNA translocase FtsK [Dehalococcoidia bacterium]
MPVKTRPRPAARTVSYRPRRSVRRRPARRLAGISRASEVPSLAWVALGAVVVLAASMPFLAPLIVDAFTASLRAFGLGLPLLVLVAGADARAAQLREGRGATFWRVLGGLHLLLLFAFGAAGLFRPDWTAGGVSFAAVSAGGNLGRALVGSPLGVLVWLGLGLSGLGVLWPGGARLAGRGAVGGLGALVEMEIPQRLAGAVKAIVVSLLPQREEAAEAGPEEPYVPRWDEEWEESPEPEADADELTAPVTAAADASAEEGEDEEPIMVTGAPDEQPASYQRPLPMGRPAGHGWELPPVDLLAEAADIEVRPLDNETRAQLIVDTLASFGVNARVVAINQGPTVTQFGVEPGWETKTRNVIVRDDKGRPAYDREGKPQYRTEVVSRTRVRVNRITTLANDLALALAAPTIRIEAPVPGKPIIGIEVPNTTTSLVALRSVIESTAFQRVNARTRLGIALGKGVSGEPAAADLAKMPHLLIAGATGSGKSVCVNSIIACLLIHNTPEDVRLVLVDPKRVELANFAQIPHLAFSKIITDPEEVVGTLQAILHEMDSRYRRFASLGVRNIEAYNKSPRATHRLPYWVVIIDELADLMMAAPYQVERQICRLAQLARATGIHLIIATQRPSVDVVTGLIKANFPTRIAFAVSSQVDSRTIIDGAGAEKLLGRGDMLFMPTDAAKPKRLQGSYVSDQELDRIVAWWTNDRFRHLHPETMDHLIQEAKVGEGEDREAEDEDPLFEAAKELAMQHSRVSTSLLQRRLHVGYPRAARLIDLLEREGIVGAAESGQSREVLAEGWEGEDRFE